MPRDSGRPTPTNGDGHPSLEFRYDPFPDLDKSLVDRLGQYPRVPDLTLDTVRAGGRALVLLLVRAQYRIDVRGAPPEGPRLAFVANHQSHLDTLAVLAALPAPLRHELVVLAARDYFFTRVSRALAASLLAQAVAFDRLRLSELRAWACVLAAQASGYLLVYPSGSRTRVEAQAGLLGILSRCGWPLVPVAIAGTAAAWPVGQTLWRPFRRLRVTFGTPLVADTPHDLARQLEGFWQEHR